MRKKAGWRANSGAAPEDYPAKLVETVRSQPLLVNFVSPKNGAGPAFYVKPAA
jgi:hypothetical protein